MTISYEVAESVATITLLQATCDQVARLAELPAFAEVKRQLCCLQTGRSR